jgi:hypothetical protein
MAQIKSAPSVIGYYFVEDLASSRSAQERNWWVSP